VSAVAASREGDPPSVESRYRPRNESPEEAGFRGARNHIRAAGRGPEVACRTEFAAVLRVEADLVLEVEQERQFVAAALRMADCLG
jgi:hypothetical protein